ncbi:MAG TPA: undecaprenyl-diphosphate phosphatase [Cellvibrionaceae bacterium]
MENLIQVILLGLIEGCTEFLPISSTGHLIIAQQLGLGERSDLFNVVIQAGAISAVTLIYWRRIWALLVGFKDAANRDYLLKLGAAFLITAALGILVKKFGIELPDSTRPVAIALILGGFWILWAEWYTAKKAPSADMNWWGAIIVGFAQIIAAIFPGTSRSGAGIFAAMLAGNTSRSAAADFVFMLGIPTMYAASAKKIIDAAQDGLIQQEAWGDVALGFIVALVSAFFVVKWLLGYIKSHRFTGFAIYRIILGVVLLAFFSQY